MPDDVALLRAIALDPTDVSRRLIYADWLEEHGEDKRTALVRHECELETMRKSDPRHGKLSRWAQMIRPRYERQALAPLRVMKINVLSYRIIGPVMTDIMLGAEDFVNCAATLFQEYPALGRVGIVVSPHTWEFLASSPYRHFVNVLNLSNQPSGDEMMRTICDVRPPSKRSRLPDLPVPPRLELHFFSLTSPIWPPIARMLPLDRLIDLSLSHVGYGARGTLGNAGLQRLADSAILAGLTGLQFANNRITFAGLAPLLASRNLNSLERLDLSGNHLGVNGTRALASCPHLRSLVSLELGSCSTGNSGAAALAASPHLIKLAHLGLSRNAIGIAGVQALAESSHMPKLTSLDLSGNSFNAECLKVLAESPLAGRLQKLTLGLNDDANRRRWKMKSVMSLYAKFGRGIHW